VRARAAGELLDRVDMLPVRDDGGVGADLPGKLERVGIPVRRRSA
jgi:hypothetical protein